MRFEKAKYKGYRLSEVNGVLSKCWMNDSINNFAGNLAVNYLYSDTGNTYFKYERGFNSPSPLKLTNKLANGESVFNDLKSVKNNVFEIGWKDYILNSLISADIYYSKLKGEFHWERYGRNHPTHKYKFVNLGETRRYGFDLKAEQKFDKFTFKEAYSYINAKIVKDKDKKIEGKYISYVPAHKFTLGINYVVNDKLNIGLDGNYTSDYYLDNANKEGMDGKKLLFNMRADYEVVDGLSVYIGINNLLNNRYSAVSYSSWGGGMSYMPEPTRNYYAGFNYKF